MNKATYARASARLRNVACSVERCERIRTRAQTEEPSERIVRTPRGLAVAIGIDCVRHRRVGDRVFEQFEGRRDDLLGIGADETSGTGFDGFGTLGRVAQHEHGLSETWRLFLNAAAVSEDNLRARDQLSELRVVE